MTRFSSSPLPSSVTVPPAIEVAAFAMVHATSMKIRKPPAVVGGTVGSPVVHPMNLVFHIVVIGWPSGRIALT